MNILDNEAFSQVLSSELDLDFEARRKGSRRRTVRRVSARKPKGQRVYSKSGKARIGRWIRV
jgi:hypothetical protein